MAVTQLLQKYLKWILVISATSFLIISQFNSSGRSSEKATETNRHKHFDYDIFTYHHLNGLTTPAFHEVPRVILRTEIRYLINNPICDSVYSKAHNAEVFMLILITSYVGDVQLRRKLRELLPQQQLDDLKVKRLFLLARPPPRSQLHDKKYVGIDMKEIYVENQNFQDILMGDFIESYKNLTFKHLMGLEWAATFCQNARYVLKQDDDVIVDYLQLLGLLRNEGKGANNLASKISNPKKLTIYGKVLENQPVERDPKSKWNIPYYEYRHETFPPYVSGWAYVTTIPAIQELLQASETSRYFFIDDAFVTGILREKTSVQLLDMNDHFTNFKGQLLCCVTVPMFAKSKNNEPFWCDYLVGPSNDDLELMEIYQRHSQYCYFSKQCRRREDHEVLVKRCVITGNMKVQDFSQLHNQVKARPLPVIRKQ